MDGRDGEPDEASSRRRGLVALPLATLVALIAALGFIVGTSNGAPRRNGSALPAAAPVTIDTFVAANTKVDDVLVTPLTVGQSIPLPADIGLIQWDTTSGVIRRVYRERGLELRIEHLFTPPQGAHVYQAAASADGRELVVTLATPNGMLTPSFTTVYRSSDGGATWAIVGYSGAGAFVTTVGPDAVVVAQDVGEGGRKRELLPGRLPVSSSAQMLATGATWPVVGTSIQQDAGIAFTRYSSGVSLNDEGYVVRFRGAGNDPVVGVGNVDASGKLLSGFTGPVRAVVGALPGRLVAVDFALDHEPEAQKPASSRLMASLIDPGAGVVYPIETGALDAGKELFTLAVQRGPLVRIEAEDGCAPVRDRPFIDGGVIFCATDGMVLREADQRVHNDYTWLRVINGSMRPGWIDISYVEP